MDLSYPELFDIVDETTFDTDLFHGLYVQDVENNKKQQQQHTHSTSSSPPSPSYLHYLQSTIPTIPATTTTNSSFFYDPMYPFNPDLIDYNYNFQQTPSTTFDQKQPYNWLYDPTDTDLPQQNTLFCDQVMTSNIMTSNQHHQFDCIMSEYDMQDNLAVEGGMSRGYVSLSEVNAFVAKADSAKEHSCLLQLSSFQDNLLPDGFSLKPPLQNRDFLSSSESANDDSEDDYSDNNSDSDLRWNSLMANYGSSVGAKMASAAAKTKKPKHMNSALPCPYREPQWDLVTPKTSKSTGYKATSNKHRKSNGKKKPGKFDSKARRGSAPHRLTIHNNISANSLGSLYSSSSLSSLSNNLQRSMHVSDSTTHSWMFDQDAAEHQPLEEEQESLLLAEEEDGDGDGDDDEEYQIRSANTANHGQLATKKGRNVDKACNHCKRSHLRCDEMRPCRRCIATGKEGCKDVEHKPRGRPKLPKLIK